jgi:hypothetical protein
MFFGHKAPGFPCLHPLEQLVTNAVHLSGMKQGSFFRALLLEGDGSCMESIMAGFAQRQQIRFLIASVLTSEDKVMHFEPLTLRFPLTLLAGVAISCEHVGFGIRVAVVDPFLIQPLVLQHFWIFQGMGIKGSRSSTIDVIGKNNWTKRISRR